MTRPLVTVACIVKNERERLPGMIRSVRPIADEIVIVDTGSSDDTDLVAHQFGARVIYAPWQDSFAAARNVSLEHARGTWILVMDADNRLLPEAVPILRGAMRLWPLKSPGGDIVTGYLLGVQEVDGNVTVSSCRLFKRSGHLRYYGRVYEDLLYDGDRSRTRWALLPGAQVTHSGYDPAAMPAKYERNLRLLEMRLKDDPHDPYTAYYFAVTYRNMGDGIQAAYWAGLALNGPGLQPLHRRELEQIATAPAPSPQS